MIEIDKSAEREAFITSRLTGVGSSDAAIVAGMSPWKSAYELWHEKTGGMIQEDISGNAPVIWGNRFERPIGEHFAEVTGKQVAAGGVKIVHPAHAFMFTHLDFDIPDEDEYVECKAVNQFAKSEWGEPGTDDIPAHYLCQVQHTLACIGKSVGWVAVLIGGNEFRIYRVERNEDFIDALIPIEAAFWRSVETRIPPILDCNAPNALTAVKKLYPGTDGTTIELPAEIMASHQALEDIREKRLLFEKTEAGLKANILLAMGSAAIGKLPDGTAYTRKVTQRKAHEVAASSFIDLRYTTKEV